MTKPFKLILFLLLILVISSSAQTIELKIKDVGIGATYRKVLQNFGKPVSIKKNEKFPCDDGKVITLNYSGLSFKLTEGLENRHFSVALVNITSNRFSVSGIKIGAAIKDVMKKFGSIELKKENGLDVLNYFITDGYAYLYFKNEKLTRISWELNVC
jgi:hypothetical protein